MTHQAIFRQALLVCILLLSFVELYAQSPQVINYQAVVRDAASAVVANKVVNFRLSILDGSVTGTPQYIETQSKTTNQFGLVTFGIGQGTTISGSMNAVTWATGNKFLKVELDINGGNNFTVMSTSQFLSVPYALYAATAGNSGGTSQWVNNSVGINYNAGSVGLGTNAPTAQLHTLGSVRFQGILQNNALTRLMVMDANNNVSWRDASTLTGTGSSGWALSGNAASGSDVLGTTNIQPLRFVTNNTQKAVLTNYGFLGIGTANPPSKLSVEANSDGSGELDERLMVDIRNTSTSWASQAIVRITAGNAGNFTNLAHTSSTYTAGSDTDSGILWSNGTGGLVLRASPKSISEPDVQAIRFLTGYNPSTANLTNERMRIASNGNVGIGTQTPTAKLHNNGSLRFEGLTFNNSATNVLVSDASGNVALRDASTLSGGSSSGWGLNGNTATSSNYLGTNNSQDLRFYTEGSQKMVLKPNGYLGVGTSAPEARLTVEGYGDGTGTVEDRVFAKFNNKSTSFASNISLQLFAGNSGTFTLMNHHSSTYNVVNASDYGQLWNTGRGLIIRASPASSTQDYQGNIRFFTGWNSGSPYSTFSTNERMRIEANGNIGIGTENPRTKLEVTNGDVYINDVTKGIIMKSPNGTCWRVTIDNSGNFVRTQIVCP